MPVRVGAGAAGPLFPNGLLKTGVNTVYTAGDNGSYQTGTTKAYLVNSAGVYAGTKNLDVPGYAAATISFVAATKRIQDTANGLAVFRTADTITVRNSGLNDGVYTVAAGGVAAFTVVVQNLVNEAAGAYVSICKREVKSNNTVSDLNTGLMWSRYASFSVGQYASDGTIAYNDPPFQFLLHPAAADLQIIAASNTLRIVGGAAQAGRYHVGDCIVCAGFANAVNNIPDYVIMSVTVNGADLDIVLNVFGATLINEAAAGARTIRLIGQAIYSYCAQANAMALAGFTNWRVPNCYEMLSIMNYQIAQGVPDAVAFPGWDLNKAYWTSTNFPFPTPPTQAYQAYIGLLQNLPIATNNRVLLVR